MQCFNRTSFETTVKGFCLSRLISTLRLEIAFGLWDIPRKVIWGEKGGGGGGGGMLKALYVDNTWMMGSKKLLTI